jgi:hypothetical protein
MSGAAAAFRPATRTAARARIMLTGPAGSGKTYSALLLASGLGRKIALIDTEHGSSELYAGLVPFDVAPLSAPYTPDRYIELLRAAALGGYDVAIVDSLSHAWAGAGGLLEAKDAASEGKGKNDWNAWATITPQHTRLIEMLLAWPGHLIITTRAKTAWALEADERGKLRPRKLGLEPVQRPGVDYEFTSVLDLDLDHQATCSKDRTPVFSALGSFVPSAEHGRALARWLASGAAATAVAAPASAPVDKPAPAPMPAPTPAPPPSTPAPPAPAPPAGDGVIARELASLGAALGGGNVHADTRPAGDDWIEAIEAAAAHLGQTDIERVWDGLVQAGHALGRRRITRDKAEEVYQMLRGAITKKEAQQRGEGQ